jgi:transcriptional regulator with XRE-family HTH domain
LAYNVSSGRRVVVFRIDVAAWGFNRVKTKKWDQILTSEANLALLEIGQLIKTARKRRLLTVKSLSQRTGVDRRTIAKIESGNPGVSMGVFIQILNILNLTRGLSAIFNPANDIDAIGIEVRRVRTRNKQQKKITDDEVNF